MVENNESLYLHSISHYFILTTFKGGGGVNKERRELVKIRPHLTWKHKQETRKKTPRERALCEDEEKKAGEEKKLRTTDNELQHHQDQKSITIGSI
jgi:hypothetical protein